MGQFDDLPYVFRLARLHTGKSTLTYDEYVVYLGIWRDMSEYTQGVVKSILF